MQRQPNEIQNATPNATQVAQTSGTAFWLVFGDIHDDIARVAEIPGLAEAAGVIISGDLTVCGGVKQASRVLDAIAAHNPNIMAQIGNMDREEVTVWMEGKGWNIHRKHFEISPGVTLMGLGCSTFTPFGTPSEHPDSRLAEWLEDTVHHAKGYRDLILISHTPPLDSACDLISDGTHVGSSAVREFIQEHQPVLCVCGHIHESRGVDRIGRTLVINPGAFTSGGYVRFSVDNGNVEAELCSLSHQEDPSLPINSAKDSMKN